MSLNDQGPGFQMSLRDWFAGQALAGFIANVKCMDVCMRTAKAGGTDPQRGAAIMAYAYADAMIMERDRELGGAA